MKPSSLCSVVEVSGLAVWLFANASNRKTQERIMLCITEIPKRKLQQFWLHSACLAELRKSSCGPSSVGISQILAIKFPMNIRQRFKSAL